jgi:hypothetical protein
MKRTNFAVGLLALIWIQPAVAGEGAQELGAAEATWPFAHPAGTSVTHFGQAPDLGLGGVLNARLADASCDVACSPARSSSAAAASPGTDILSLAFRINEVEVWGIYQAGASQPGLPPDLDSFTVNLHLPGFPFDLPATEVCSRTGVAGTRAVVGNVLGFDVYRHTLRLPDPCFVVVPGNRVYWIEVFNDTGPSADWFWLGGLESFWWPVDCCENYGSYGTGADPLNAPGQEWGPVFAPLAFESRAIFVGEALGLRLSKLPDDELRLEWDGDCGGGGDFSVYRGSLADGYASAGPESGLCEVAGTSAVVPLGQGEADFFLIVPWVASGGYGDECGATGESCRNEGSYGAASDGTPRAQPATHCYAQVGPDLHDCAP